MFQIYDNLSDAEGEAIKSSSAHQSKIYAVAQTSNKKYCVVAEPMDVIGHGILQISDKDKLEYHTIEHFLNGIIYNDINKIYQNGKRAFKREKFEWSDDLVLEFINYIIDYDKSVLADISRIKNKINAFKDYKFITSSLDLGE